MAKTLKCPKCAVEMLKLTQLGIEIDVCPLCNGTWLDRDELRLITRSRGEDAVVARVINKKPTQFNCPRCGGTLREGVHERHLDFLIDECDDCQGMWLDRGELPRLLVAKPVD